MWNFHLCLLFDFVLVWSKIFGIPLQKLSTNGLSEANPSHKMYNNQSVSLFIWLETFSKINFLSKWDSSSGSGRMYGSGQSTTGMQSQNQRWTAPGPIQRPNAGFHQNYLQQRRINTAAVNSSGMSMTSQGKSQYFMSASKCKIWAWFCFTLTTNVFFSKNWWRKVKNP